MQITLFILMVLVALCESWFQPWLAVAGVTIPLTLIALSLMQINIDRNLLPWLGFLGGLVIDLQSAGYFGVNSLYYLLVAWIMAQLLIHPRYGKNVWLGVGVLSIAALIQPWYLLVAERQLGTDFGYVLWVSLMRTGWVVGISGSAAWFLSHREAAHL